MSELEATPIIYLGRRVETQGIIYLARFGSLVFSGPLKDITYQLRNFVNRNARIEDLVGRNIYPLSAEELSWIKAQLNLSYEFPLETVSKLKDETKYSETKGKDRFEIRRILYEFQVGKGNLETL